VGKQGKTGGYRKLKDVFISGRKFKLARDFLTLKNPTTKPLLYNY